LSIKSLSEFRVERKALDSKQQALISHGIGIEKRKDIVRFGTSLSLMAGRNDRIIYFGNASGSGSSPLLGAPTSHAIDNIEYSFKEEHLYLINRLKFEVIFYEPTEKFNIAAGLFTNLDILLKEKESEFDYENISYVWNTDSGLGTSSTWKDTLHYVSNNDKFNAADYATIKPTLGLSCSMRWIFNRFFFNADFNIGITTPRYEILIDNPSQEYYPRTNVKSVKNTYGTFQIGLGIGYRINKSEEKKNPA
jgi:hypothetical protein